MSHPKLLEIAELTVSIGASHIIKNLSLEVGAGEILGLVGASGSGKSMTALSVMRLLPSTASSTGVVRLNGENLTEKAESQMQAIRGRGYRGRGHRKASCARRAPGVQAHRHLRGRIRLAHRLHVFDL